MYIEEERFTNVGGNRKTLKDLQRDYGIRVRRKIEKYCRVAALNEGQACGTFTLPSWYCVTHSAALPSPLSLKPMSAITVAKMGRLSPFKSSTEIRERQAMPSKTGTRVEWIAKYGACIKYSQWIRCMEEEEERFTNKLERFTNKLERFTNTLKDLKVWKISTPKERFNRTV